MLINDIRNDQTLKDFICTDCEENDVGITIHPSIDPAEIVIIKADAYLKYAFHPNPAGPDCLIIQHCQDGTYRIFIIELKNIKDLGSYSLTHIRAKFQNCFDLIMSDKYRALFYDMQYDIKSIFLVFVSNNAEQQGKHNNDKKQKNTRLDSLLALPPCRFANKYYYLMYKEPYPTIGLC